ncbi:haloacid dehalogenase family hydrolase domain-containing protein [Cyclospora cayetanensis]|uniref:Haloacid dehalogenase family hydrolase domain-containing protein n=1 Tax=Cyclospora cayetanensis TaxID=88456 RepID=A0A1D3CYP8_9EIME|nr:haloacid dehalogenase family hydrolase domain-containing protein [Cyclospora cayetanensis]
MLLFRTLTPSGAYRRPLRPPQRDRERAPHTPRGPPSNGETQEPSVPTTNVEQTPRCCLRDALLSMGLEGAPAPQELRAPSGTGRRVRSWVLLLLLLHVLDGISVDAAAASPFQNAGLEGNSQSYAAVASALSLGNNGDALNCPASRLTTPVSLRMIFYTGIYYVFVLVLLLGWLLWRRTLWGYYLRRQCKQEALRRGAASSAARTGGAGASTNESGSESASDRNAKRETPKKDYVWASPIIQHGGMLFQEYGYKLSPMGFLVYGLVILSIVVSVLLPFFAGFAANSVTPADKLTRYVPLSLYEGLSGSPLSSAEDAAVVAASPQCITLRVYIFSGCFIWCLLWMVVVHIWRQEIRRLVYSPCVLSRSTHILVDRKLQKILLRPERRQEAPIKRSNGTTDMDFLKDREDIGEPPLTTNLTSVCELPHAAGRYAEASRVRMVYDPMKGYFVPAAAMYERQARKAAEALAGFGAEADSHGGLQEDAVSGCLESLSRNLLDPKEVVKRRYVDGELGLWWTVRPVSSLLVASFLQDEFYLITLMALWYQAFALNNLQAVILLALPIVELTFGVCSLRRGERQLERLMEREAEKLENRRILVLRLKAEEAEGAAATLGKEPHASESAERKNPLPPRFVLTRARASEVIPGDLLLLQAGDEAPCDMLLVHGSLSLDESHLTGETEPVLKVPLGNPSPPMSMESVDSDWGSAKVAEDEVLDPSNIASSAITCVYAGSKIVHTSCRSDLAATMFELDSVGEGEAPAEPMEKDVEDPVSLLLGDDCCWGMAVRTHGETMQGQLLRQLHLPTVIRFKYHEQFPLVLLAVIFFAFALMAIQSPFTKNIVDAFRFAIEKLLRMVPLYLPALWGICASLNAKRLGAGRFRTKQLPYPQTYKAAAVLPGLLPLAAKIRVVCFDKTGTLTQNELCLLGAHPVSGGAFERLVRYKPQEEEAAEGTKSIFVDEQEETEQPVTQYNREPVEGTLSVPLRQCLACCNGLRVTAHGVAAWTRKQQAAFREQSVLTGKELGKISSMTPALTYADLEGGCIEKQALAVSGYHFVEIASANLTTAKFPRLLRATTTWAAELQKQRNTRQFVIPRDHAQEAEAEPMLEILQTYGIDQITGMVTVVVRECRDTGGCKGQKGYIYTKGRYEEVARICRGSTVPSDYLSAAKQHVKAGVYVMGAAYRELTPQELATLDEQREALPRRQLESDLECLGLVLFRNELRTDAKDAVEELCAGGIHCVMLTGDNPYTAIAVARRANLVRPRRQAQDTRQGGSEDAAAEEEEEDFKEGPPVLLGNATVEPGEPSLSGLGEFHGVKWTDVRTGEDIDPWRVYYTNEFKELALTMAAAKILMMEPDKQSADHVGDAADDIEDPWRRTPREEAFKEHAERVALLSERLDWQSGVPSLFDRIFFRIRVFARMSPMGKKLVILHYQRRGLTTCMVGDGSNDSLAIRQADVGVEMGQVQPAPFSAPFAIFHTGGKPTSEGSTECTHGKDGVRGLVDIVRVGRCSLSTAMAIYKLHISYGLLAATASLLIVVAQYSGMNAIAGLFLDLVVLLGLSFSMLFSTPTNGPLAPKSPPSSPFGAGVMTSVLTLVAVDLGSLALLLYLFYGPGAFPEPCYWVQSRIHRELTSSSEKKELSSVPETLDPQKTGLFLERAAVVRQNPSAPLQGGRETPQGNSELSENRERAVQRAGVVFPSLLQNDLSLSGGASSPSGKTAEVEGEPSFMDVAASLSEALKAPLESISMPLKHANSAFLPAELDTARSHWSLPAFMHTDVAVAIGGGSSGGGALYAPPYDALERGNVCSTDGHTEAGLVFIWTGICVLHAGVLFISGNVFRRSAWRNRVLLPFSLLLFIFFLCITLLPPNPFSCVFNVNCTVEASQGLRNSVAFPAVQALAGDSASSILHDASDGPPTVEAAANRAATELSWEARSNGSDSASTLVQRRTADQDLDQEPSIVGGAEYMRQEEQKVHHLWTDEEAAILWRWFGKIMLCVLLGACLLNTLIQLICLHKVSFTEWWSACRSRQRRGNSVPL